MSYPTLNLKALTALTTIRANMAVDDKYLDKSPYGADVRAELEKLLEVRVETVVVGAKQQESAKSQGITDRQAEDIEVEANLLLKELKELKPPTGKGFDHDTKIQIIKAKTSLIDKVVSIQERAFNVRRVATFQKVVTDILQDLVEPDRIKEFQDRLGAYL